MSVLPLLGTPLIRDEEWPTCPRPRRNHPFADFLPSPGRQWEDPLLIV